MLYHPVYFILYWEQKSVQIFVQAAFFQWLTVRKGAPYFYYFIIFLHKLRVSFGFPLEQIQRIW